MLEDLKKPKTWEDSMKEKGFSNYTEYSLFAEKMRNALKEMKDKTLSLQNENKKS